MKKTLLLLAVFAAFAAQCAAPKADVAVPADAEEPFFEPPAIDLEGSPAEGLFNYNFWRRLTEAEKTNGVARLCKAWKDATACQAIPDGCESKMEVTLLKDGRYFVDWTFVIKDDNLPPLPRVGLTFPLQGSFTNVRWNGRGPWENYPARRNSAKFGTYAANLSLVGDTMPNFGYRAACRWIEVSEPMGRGMRIEAVSAPFGFSIRPISDTSREFRVNIDAYFMGQISPDETADLTQPKKFRLSFLVSEL